MAGKVIVPPDYLKRISGPLIFLAGPIQGAHKWHDEAIIFIQSMDSDIYIASPRRDMDIDHDFTQEMYNEQVDWETYHLRRAGKTGAILFWLSKELNHICERAYAQTSRFEIGEWKSRCERGKIGLIVGIEEGFTGAKYIRRRFSQDCPNVHMCSSLKETCEKAILIARKKG